MRIINYLLLLLILALAACKKDTGVDSVSDSHVKVYDFKTTSAKETSDGGYVLTTSVGITKISADGTVEWSKKYLEYNTDTISFRFSTNSRILQNSDGGYTILLYGIFKALDNNYFCIVKTDAKGNKVSVFPYYFSFMQGTFSDGFLFQETIEKGYLISFVYIDLSGINQRAVYKIDASGKIVWITKALTYFTYPDGDIRDLIVTKNNEYVLVGTYSYYAKGAQIFFTYFGRYSSSGTILSEKQYAMGGRADNGNFVPSTATKVAQTASNDLMLFGYADRGRGSAKTHNQYMAIKVSANGDSLTSLVLGTVKQDYCNYGILTSDQGYALIGFSSPIDDAQGLNLKTSMYFIKLSQSLEIQKSLVYGDNLDTQGLFVKENANKSYTLIGTKYGYSNLGKSQTLFIRTLSAGGL
jgi:hypothetical protein